MTLTTTSEKLMERDPSATSLISSKLRLEKSKKISMCAAGPNDDEYMSPTLIQFVWDYIDGGVRCIYARPILIVVSV